MKFKEVKTNKKQYLYLLLLADEQEDMIDRYIEKGIMYILDDNGIKCECVVTDGGNGILEIKNIGARKALQVELDFPNSNPLLDLNRNLASFEEKLKGQHIELMPQQSIYYDLGHSVVETDDLCAQQ